MLRRGPLGGCRGGDRARGRGFVDGRLSRRLDPHRRPRQRQGHARRGATLLRGGAGQHARQGWRAEPVLRRHRQARRRTYAFQDFDQRTAARLMSADPIAIARDLLRCRSVTPAEGGALKYLERVLKDAGFTVHHLAFSEPGEDMVENLYARLGNAAPNLMFAGHTDVVPPGDEAAWTHPPFAGENDGKQLYGRGAVDMKGGIACALAAVLDHLAERGKPKGSISFLITGDEEGIAVNGTPKLLKWATEQGEKFDHCILGEPSNVEALGDTIKIGRRGSLNGHLIVRGRQGHVAYPERADNPIR